MSSLFKENQNPVKAQQDSYSAKDIEVLEGLEPVRRRPGMYIGGTDERALHHLAAEILDNAMDEAVAGFATRIDFSLNKEGFIIIQDNGRGIPIDPHPKYPDQSALEVILTTLHSGGKFTTGVYSTSGGLHGVGLSVVNALSDKLIIEVARDGQVWEQKYSKGAPISSLTLAPNASLNRGTRISFHPDPEIFGDTLSLKPALLYKMARSKAYLYKGVKIVWSCSPDLITDGKTPSKETIHFPKGLVDFLEQTVPAEQMIVSEPFSGTVQFSEDQGQVEWAITWTHADESNIQSYCNTVPTPLGGTHETGFRNAIMKALKNFGDLTKNKKATQITPDDVFYSAVAVLSTFIKDPQFQGQTKEKLVTAGATKLVENAVKDHFDHWLTGHPDIAQVILASIIDRSEERLRLKSQKDTSRKSPTQRLRLPGKLADCTQEHAKGSEIFLVEGDSAGGSAKQARDRNTQAVLPLRGKILNVASATTEKLMLNQELKDLTQALGCGSGKSFSLEKLRYERVVIMTDADVDGAHIAALLMTFFFQEMRPLITKGHLYLAQPPLYRLTHGGKSIYARDDEEKEKFLKTIFKGSDKVEMSRFKGLGEMSAPQLKETTMDKTKRTLIRVELPHGIDPEEIDVDDFVDQLMGRHPEKRYAFIQANARFVEDLDI
jgi:topoisomerase-4 subunit B